MLLTLANRVLKTGNAIDELSVLLKTRLSGEQRRGYDKLMPRKHFRKFGKEEENKLYQNEEMFDRDVAIKENEVCWNDI